MKGRPDERLQNDFEFWNPFAGRLFRLVQGGKPGFVHWNDAALENSGNQILLAPEMIIDGGQVDLRFPGDVSNGNTVETPFAEQFLRHIENPRSCATELFHTFV